MINKTITEKSSIILLSLVILFILNSLLVCARVDLIAPDDNTYTNQLSISLDYYVSLDNVTNCTLILDSEFNITDTSFSYNFTNSSFNTFTLNLNAGSHTWSIMCNSINNSESSEQRKITVDIIEPTIVLVSPPNDTQINSTNIDITFIAFDTSAGNISCDILLNNIINKSVIVEESDNVTSVTTNITGLSDGLYEWMITCYDLANNSATSETRVFKVNTTSPEPEFNINIEKTEYVIGEYGLMTITAPNSTSIRVKVCPDQPGFVECEVPVNAQNFMNYPFQEYLPFTNYEGKYILEAYFNYSGIAEVQELNYEVKNNINIDIDADDSPRNNIPIILEAQASGGAGTLNYTWHLSNGSTVNNDWVNITYTETGDYTETVVVKDSYNNTKNKSITIDVSNAFYIEIIVKDSVTNAPIKGASVEIKDEQKQTDTYGKVYYYLREGRKEIIILRENYSIYFDKLNITTDETFIIFLEPLSITEPKVTLLRPENNSRITGPTNELVFKAEYNNLLNCSIYINEDNDGFFIYIGSIEVRDSSEQRFDVIELENKTYRWKVDCIDNNGNSGISETWGFIVGENPSSEMTLSADQESEDLKTYDQESEDTKTYNAWIKEFEQILDKLENLPKDEKEAADALGIIKTIKDTIEVFKNTIRDLDTLNFRNDLPEEEKQAEKEKLITKAEEAYQTTPVNIEVLNSDSFVDYIDQTELTELLKEYLKVKNVSKKLNQKKLLAFLEDLQKEIVVSTKTKNARITYKDGTKSELTAVIREIKTYNITQGAFILEVIPKEVVQTADDILSLYEYEVIKQDPIIKFELKKDTTIVYYFEKNLNLELLRNIRTAVFIDPDSVDDDKITGFLAKKLNTPKLKGIIFIPIIVILIGGLIFVGIKYNGLDTARYVFYKLYGYKDLHHINVILNEINDNLDTGNVGQALASYKEAKTVYSELSTLAKNDVYERVAEVATKIKNK